MKVFASIYFKKVSKNTEYFIIAAMRATGASIGIVERKNDELRITFITGDKYGYEYTKDRVVEFCDTYHIVYNIEDVTEKV